MIKTILVMIGVMQQVGEWPHCHKEQFCELLSVEQLV